MRWHWSWKSDTREILRNPGVSLWGTAAMTVNAVAILSKTIVRWR